jgi:solute carrier family 13 (sodium-dependent dicarboxylate transporter), member 2/3/5
LIGTPPNLIFQAQLKLLFPAAPVITFAQWLFFGLPLGLLVLIIMWLYLKVLYLRNVQGQVGDRQMFINEYQAMGPWSQEQTMVGLSFTTLAALWVFRRDLDFSSFSIKGWASIFPDPTFISDGTIGMFFAIIMFLTPARPSMLPGAPGDADTKRSTTLMDWESVNKMPYDIIWLFGGGFALAMGFTESGLSSYLGDILGKLDVSLAGQVFLIVFLISFVTCLTSNTATASIMIPISAAIALGAGVSPYTFMIPTTFACSCAFCLPVATPPNMVVFASGRLPIGEMMRAGFFLNVLCSVLILAATFTIIPAVLNVDADELPEWAIAA